VKEEYHSVRDTRGKGVVPEGLLRGQGDGKNAVVGRSGSEMA